MRDGRDRRGRPAFKKKLTSSALSPFTVSPGVVADLRLDDPAWLATIATDAARERKAGTPPHIMLARVGRLLWRPTAAQRAVEADADALTASYGLWHGQRIAAHCGLLDAPEAGRTPDAWRLCAHELSWRMGFEDNQT